MSKNSDEPPMQEESSMPKLLANILDAVAREVARRLRRQDDATAGIHKQGNIGSHSNDLGGDKAGRGEGR